MPTSIPWTVPAAKSADQSSPARNSRKPLLRSSLLEDHRGKSRGQVCISQGICSSPSLRPNALFVISAQATTILHDWSTIQQTGRIRQRCAVKEPHVYVRSEYIDVAEGRISQTCNRAAVMQKLPNFVPAFSHHLKPLMRDGSQFTCMLFHPRIDGGIPLDSAVESQQIRSHRRSTFCFEICGYVTLLSSLQQNPLSGTVFLVLRIR